MDNTGDVNQNQVPEQKKQDYQTTGTYALDSQSTLSKLTPSVLYNVTFSALVTTAAVSILKGPLDVAAYSIVRGGKSPISDVISHGTLALIKYFYTGFATSVVFNMPRSMFILTGKSGARDTAGTIDKRIESELALKVEADTSEQVSHAIETTTTQLDQKVLKNRSSGHEVKASFLSRFALVAGMSGGEVILTQHNENIVGLRQAKVIPAFKWYTPYNFVSIGKAAIGMRYTTGLVNFGSLCLLEGFYANLFSDYKKKQPELTHAVAGAMSGATAAVVSYVPAALKDSVIVSAKLNEKKQVVFDNAWTIVKNLMKNPQNNFTMANFRAIILPTLCLKMLKSAGTFSVIALSSELLGERPVDKMVDVARSNLSKHSLFNEPKVEVKTKADTDNTKGPTTPSK